MSDGPNIEGLSESQREALFAQVFGYINGTMEEFRALYGEVGIHSKPDGSWCLHLRDEKGCQQPTFMEVIIHGIDHYAADSNIQEAADEVGFDLHDE